MFNNIYRNKKVLITGHTGFKGSWLSLWLHELGADVAGFSLKPPTEPNFFDICGLDRKINSGIGDIRDKKGLKSAFLKYQPEFVFHLAAQPLVRLAYKDPVGTYETNIMGTVNVLEECRKCPSVKVIVNVTSDKCYENNEWVWGYRENDRMGGYDPYSSSKGCAEIITNAYLNSFFNPDNFLEHKKLLASARAGNVIGGGDWAFDRLIPDCIKALIAKNPVVIRNPLASRPWQHVLDVLYAYMLLAQTLYENGSEFTGGWNFGPNYDSKTVEWVVSNIIKLWGEGASYKIDNSHHPHEANSLKLDCSKALKKLKYQTQFSASDAVKKTVEWYMAFNNNRNMLDISLEQISHYELQIL